MKKKNILNLMNAGDKMTKCTVCIKKKKNRNATFFAFINANGFGVLFRLKRWQEDEN